MGPSFSDLDAPAVWGIEPGLSFVLAFVDSTIPSGLHPTPCHVLILGFDMGQEEPGCAEKWGGYDLAVSAHLIFLSDPCQPSSLLIPEGDESFPNMEPKIAVSSKANGLCTAPFQDTSWLAVIPLGL